MNHRDNDMITVAVPPQRLGWLNSQLDANGIPHQDDGRGNVTTLEMAQPIIEQVLGYQSQAQHKRAFSIGGFFRAWVPWCWLALACATAYAGGWWVALIAVGGAVLRSVMNAWVERRYRHAEQYGSADLMAKYRRGDALYDFVFGGVMLFVSAVIVAVVMGVL